MPSPHRERHDSYMLAYKQTNVAHIIGMGRETVAARKDGSTFPAELAVSEFFIDGTKYFTGVIRDLSDRKRIERMQSEFVSTVSHELRTPLTSIRGSLGLVAGGVTGELPREAREYLDIAVSNSDRLVRLVNDILDMEKMQSGKMEFRFRPTDLGVLVQSAIAANRAFAEAQNVQLVETGDWPMGEVYVDPDRVTQVLSNLISNAVKFSSAGSNVELSVERIAQSFRVSIRDYGPGISAEFRTRIFQRFSQGDASTTRKTGGTGLGLAISKSIIERMHGQIDFCPAPERGTIFFFDLPRQAATSTSMSGPPQGQTQGRPRVLHIEGSEDLRRVVRRTLPKTWTFAEAAGVGDARSLLTGERFDVVVLDPDLPDGSGYELFEVMGKAKIIVFSAAELDPRCTERVSVALVKSHFHPEDLREAILRIAGGASNTGESS